MGPSLPPFDPEPPVLRRLLGVVLPLVPNEGAADVVTPLPASIEEIDPFDARDPCTVSSLCIICVSLSSRSLRCPSAPPLLLEESTCTFDASVREWIDSDRRTRNAVCPTKKLAKKMPAYFAYFDFWRADVAPKPTLPAPTREGPSGRVGLLSTVTLMSYLNACSLSRTMASFSSSLA